MKKTRPTMPRARREALVIEELPDETLVYDLKRHKAHCLNRAAAAVWRHCDGGTTVPQMAVILEQESDLPRDEGIVRLALDRLHKAKLLEEGANIPQAAGYSRRELVRKMAVLGGVSLLLPIVTSINSPVAAMQATSTTGDACASMCSGVGLPCSDEPGTTCTSFGPGDCECI